MNLVKRVFTIELSPEEIALVTNALGNYYREQKELEKDEEAPVDFKETVMQIKDLRNDFGGLIGVSYMGKDA